MERKLLMKIALLGATGRVGQNIAALAHQEGHTVHALVRDKEKAQALLPHATLYVGDATSKQDVENLIKTSDGVISALNTDKSTTLTEATPLLIDAMQTYDIKRIVTIGTAGILNSRLEEGKFRFQSSESKRKTTFAAEEHAKAYQMLERTNLQWTVVCPTYLPEGEIEGNIRAEINVLPEDGKKITTGDTAQFAFQCFLDHSYLQTRVGICY